MSEEVNFMRNCATPGDEEIRRHIVSNNLFMGINYATKK